MRWKLAAHQSARANHETDHAMVNIDDFRSSASGAMPPDLSPALQALWWARGGDWDRAHGCVQQHEGEPDCDLVHAHLHRQEGDLANAGEWYRSAGRPVATVPIAEEWTAIATELLSRK